MKMFLLYLVYYDFTGCDNIPAFLRKGKIKYVELVIKYNSFIEWLQANGLEELSQTTINQCKTLMCHVFVLFV